jgi:hypothetical protein
MTIWWVIGGIASVAVLIAIFLLLDAVRRKPAAGGADAQQAGAGAQSGVATDGAAKVVKIDNNNLVQASDNEVDRIFNDEFREELRNRGRLHFEKIIGENAMFLQQDLRLTTSQLNEYMKQEITAKLKEEFSKYEESITDAKQLAIDAIDKTKQAVEEEREALVGRLREDFAEEKAMEIKRFEDNMTDIVNHYLLAAIGNEIDLGDQLEYIIANLEANKKAIIEDIINGA